VATLYIEASPFTFALIGDVLADTMQERYDFSLDSIDLAHVIDHRVGKI
jgi:hypothetical protein